MYDVEKEYETNKAFREYVNSCCKNKPVTPEELLKDALVYEVGLYCYNTRKGIVGSER